MIQQPQEQPQCSNNGIGIGGQHCEHGGNGADCGANIGGPMRHNSQAQTSDELYVAQTGGKDKGKGGKGIRTML